MANPSKQKGTTYETGAVRFFNDKGIKAERLAEGGCYDEGDVRLSSWPWEFALECKNRKRIEMAKWFGEIEAKAERKGRTPALLIHRDGCGEKRFGKGYVVIDADTFAELLKGE